MQHKPLTSEEEFLKYRKEGVERSEKDKRGKRGALYRSI